VEKIGKFSVVDTLGSGAHSSILHVRRDEDGKDYALKMVPIDGKDDLKYLEQAKHEYRVGQMLHHPNRSRCTAWSWNRAGSAGRRRPSS
jgi:eukaryotic-like serine/threonine-protein kinase